MKILLLAAALAAGPALACDSDLDGNAFFLKDTGGTIRMIGSLEELKRMQKALRGHGAPTLWTRIDGHEYVIDDVAIVGRAREIFMRSEPMDREQEALERDMERLDRRQEDLDEREDAAEDEPGFRRDDALHAKLDAEERELDLRQDELDSAHDQESDQMARDLEALAREAIRSGKAR